MSWEPSVEDIVAAREQGDLAALLLMAAGVTPTVPKQQQAEPEKPCYHIRHQGAWPCGTAATGPTPAPCSECQEAAA
ncbi:hypothetical protein AB0I87_18580 [Streptomyces sp. NPDC049952]|uniref:hypothetical protein n=1 Tax=Streptomyces sp. NPDC049952 TaxID=3156665 RepID=UPI003436E6BE